MNTENTSIRKAITNDINSVMEVIKSCTIDMISKNIFQWNDKYPNIETFKNDIVNKHLYVLVSENDILGCVSITFEMDDFYKKIDWISTTNKNIYVHRLAIHPKYQGLGYAALTSDTKCMKRGYAAKRKMDDLSSADIVNLSQRQSPES